MSARSRSPAGDRRSRRAGSRAAYRERIIEAVCELLVEVDLADLRVRAIAERAGVCHMTIYNIFGSKAELIQEICWREKEEFRRRLEQTSADDSLDLIFETLVIAARAPAAQSRYFHSMAEPPQLAKAGGTLEEQTLGVRSVLWRELIQGAVQEGRLQPDTPVDEIAALMSHLVSGAFGHWLANLISSQDFEHHVAMGFAALLSPYATACAEDRLRRRLQPEPDLDPRRLPRSPVRSQARGDVRPS